MFVPLKDTNILAVFWAKNLFKDISIRIAVEITVRMFLVSRPEGDTARHGFLRRTGTEVSIAEEPYKRKLQAGICAGKEPGGRLSHRIGLQGGMHAIMKMSSIIKKITPPIIYQAMKRMKTPTLPEFSSWNEALKASTENAYEHGKLTKLVFEKTKKYCDNLSQGRISVNNSEIQTLTALGIAISQYQQSEKITVIDFGGACGAHYFLAKHIFSTIGFDWRVIETPGMVKEARNLESNELRFFNDAEHATKDIDLIHLVHSSGTLQCISEPYQALEYLVNIKANFMLLSRLGVTPEVSEIITIHRHMMSANGPGPAPKDFEDEICIYPFKYPVRNKIENILLDSYSIGFLNDDPSGKFSVGSHKIVGITYFCRKKEKANDLLALERKRQAGKFVGVTSD